MTFQSTGGGPIDGALTRFANDVRARKPAAVNALAVALKAEIQLQLSKPGQGRYYAKVAQTSGAAKDPSYKKRRARNRRLNAVRVSYARNLNNGSTKFGDISRRNVITGLHRASKPGDPPAADTGSLKRSAFIEKTEKGARVGVAMAYATPLEYGTTRAGRSRKVVILPRPFMRPALAAVRAQFGSVVVSSLRVGPR